MRVNVDAVLKKMEEGKIMRSNGKKIKGIISCPHCGQGKTVVFEGTTGSSSQGCNRCGNFYEADYDHMIAFVAKQMKGVCNMAISREHN